MWPSGEGEGEEEQEKKETPPCCCSVSLQRERKRSSERGIQATYGGKLNKFMDKLISQVLKLALIPLDNELKVVAHELRNSEISFSK